MHFETVVVKLVSPTRVGAASTPSGTSFFKVVSENAVFCHTSSVYCDRVLPTIHHSSSHYLSPFVVIYMTVIKHLQLFT